MLQDFLISNRDQLINRCRSKASERFPSTQVLSKVGNGVPVFIDQLIETLLLEEASGSKGSNGQTEQDKKINESAIQYGRELQRDGVAIDELVHHYGDICQVVTGLAMERRAIIQVAEFKTLNRCLDDAIAGAASAFSDQRYLQKPNNQTQTSETQASNEKLGTLAHELRNHIHTAMLAMAALREGKVGLSGATGALLDRSLIGLRELVDGSLAEVKENAGTPVRKQPISVADFISKITISASLEAQSRSCTLMVHEVDKTLVVDVDNDMLFSAVGNLLQNAFKFTHRNSEVSLRAYALTDRVLIEVADHCGGLPPNAAEKMFLPFTQIGADQSGAGLGLTIAQRSIEANNGQISVRDIPGSGCVFTIDLPRHIVH